MKYIALAVVLGSWIAWEYKEFRARKHRALIQRIIRMSPPAKAEKDAGAPVAGAGR